MDTKENRSFNLCSDILAQCEAMVRFALSNGKQVPGDIVEMLQACAVAEDMGSVDIKQLTSVHDRLVQIVAPASPATIQLFDGFTASSKPLLVSVPLVRRMMFLAGAFLFCIIAISLSPDIGEKAGNADMFNSSGWPLFINEVFLLCAAGLGATFAALFQVNRYIVNCTYDPKYESSYWIKFVLGLIAGFMLSELIDVHSGPVGAMSTNDLTRPVLAMIGGFSATVVYRILTRLTETVESLFQGDTKAIIASQQEAIKARLTQQLNQDRLKLAAGLIDLQKLVASGATDELKQKLDKALADLIPIELNANGSVDDAAKRIPVPIISPGIVTPSDRGGIVAANPKSVN